MGMGRSDTVLRSSGFRAHHRARHGSHSTDALDRLRGESVRAGSDHACTADDPETSIDPFNREDAAALLATVRERTPEWYPWLLWGGLRTGLRAGELLALQWGDVNWRGSYLVVRQNLVRGLLTTPKSHQQRRVDLSRQLRAELRLWRRRQRAA
jgi:integrase